MNCNQFVLSIAVDLKYLKELYFRFSYKHNLSTTNKVLFDTNFFKECGTLNETRGSADGKQNFLKQYGMYI